MAELGKNVQFFNLSLPSSDQIRYPNLVQPLPSTAQSGCFDEPPPPSSIRTIISINTTGSKGSKLIQSIPSSSTVNKFSRISEEELNPNLSSKTTRNLRRKKKTKIINDCGNSEGEKSSKEVIHVRARRGQATDSHSLAERMRREKINSKLKCLQEIVPGCHKEMGMTLMLDQIINYVHSLQSQIEYLSMELEAAFAGDGNFKPTKSNEGTRSHEGEAMERWAQEEYGEYNCLNMSTWPQ